MALGRGNAPIRDPKLPRLSFDQLRGCHGWETHCQLASIIAHKFPRLHRLGIKLRNGMMSREKDVALVRDNFETVLRGIWEEDGLMGHLEWSVKLETN